MPRKKKPHLPKGSSVGQAKKSKTPKGKVKKTRKRTRVVNPQKLLLEKIDRIKQRVPHIEPTGECKDPNTGEVLFRFTEAQIVFEIYREQCDMEQLHYRPYVDDHIQPKAIAIGNMPLLIGTFCIEDLETGAKIIGWGSGMGRNLDWSANTAGTRALKQFLLTTFEATWEDPQDPGVTKEKMKEEVIRELEADGTLSRIEQLKFWTQTLGQKGKPNASTGRKNTQSGTNPHHKKNRKRT